MCCCVVLLTTSRKKLKGTATMCSSKRTHVEFVACQWTLCAGRIDLSFVCMCVCALCSLACGYHCYCIRTIPMASPRRRLKTSTINVRKCIANSESTMTSTIRIVWHKVNRANSHGIRTFTIYIYTFTFRRPKHNISALCAMNFQLA